MSITADSLLPRLKWDCDVGYVAVVKGASVVVVFGLADSCKKRIFVIRNIISNMGKETFINNI